jgi:uncharacterized membrane protein (GlpM family)
MMQLVFRFIVGGLMVSLFAVISDGLKPKSFAGLFGAAPSVALATLALTVFKDGKLYASLEARSMIVGAIAFLVYCLVCVSILAKTNARATTVTISALALWVVCAVGFWAVLLR